MRVLLVTLRAFEVNSSVTISNMGLLRGLVESGCEVDLLMPSISQNLTQYDSVKDAYKGVTVIRIGGNAAYESLVAGKNNRIKKVLVDALRVIFYKISLFDNTIGLVKKADAGILDGTMYDLVISTSDPKTSHIYVQRLIEQGLKYGVWVQHWGDPLCMDITKKSIYPNSYIRKREAQLFGSADLLVYVSPLTLLSQKEIFPSFKEKMRFVPLPYYMDKRYPQTENEKLTLGYFGDYSSKIRDIMPLYSLCRQNNNYNLIIAGGSDLSLEAQNNIKVLPRMAQEEVDKYEEKCDILVCVCNRSGTQIPGKIYYYSATNKPILVILDGDYKNQIEEYLSAFHRFELCDNTCESINKKVVELSEMKQVYTSCADFSPKAIVHELLSFVDQEMKGVK